MSSPTSSFLSLNINNITFLITKAHIKESLESLWRIECEGYIESLQEHPFTLDSFASIKNNSHITSALNNPTSTLNFHPDTLINKQATFSIENPYTISKEKNTLVFNNTSVKALASLKTSNTNGIFQGNKEQGTKVYTGILSFVEYLGLNPQSSANVLNRAKESKGLNHKHFFTFTLTSPLMRMSLNKANRIYTDKTIVEAIQTTLDFHKEAIGKNLDFSHLHLSYPKLELITQYKESDLDFITRLAHNNGIYFYEDDHSIYFNDFSQKENPRNVLFNPKSNNTLNEPCITSFYKQQTLKTNSFTQSSENALNPFALQNLSLKSDLNSQKENGESSFTQDFIYNEHHYLSEASFTQNIDLKTPLSLKEKRTQVLHNCFQAQSNIYDLFLNQHINIDFSQSIKESKDNLKDFYIIAIEHLFINEALLANNFNSNDELIKKENVFTKNNLKDMAGKELSNAETQRINTLASLDTSSLNSAKAYSNILTFLPITFSYTPSLKSKPKAPNSTLGVVIGEDEDIESKKNTIHTDEYGRVRVRINCFASQEVIDNDAAHKSAGQKTQENHTTNNSVDSNNSQTKAYSYHYSPYLRVSSPIASQSSGFYHTPRIGDEVIVSFFDEDIDKPYVSGSLYNQSNPTLPSLPLASHQTSLSARTLNEESESIEEGLNEITLSNLKDKEHIYLQAQKDYEELIKHNFLQNIQNNKESQVEGTYNERIKKIHAQTIDLAKIVSIGGEYNTNVALSKDTLVGGSHTLNIGASNKLRVAKDSSEYVGEDKEVEIQGNLNTSIEQDESRNIKGNKSEMVEGDKQAQIEGNLNITTQSQGNIYTQKGLYVESQTLSFQVKDVANMESDSVSIDAQSDCAIQAGNQILHQVGDTSITTKGDSVIIKAGGIEVVIDSKGLLVKGGEIKAE